MSRPVIAMCTAVKQARWSVWDQQATLLPAGYARSIQAAGAIAVLLPPDEELAQRPAGALDLVDGLLLAGGADVDPLTYGARPHPETGPTYPERDRFELALASAALERDLPLLGVCRGMHMLNVAAGGTLVQHLPDVVGHARHRHTPGAFADHDVRLAPGSLAACAAGSERHAVKSHHHQGVDQLGEGVVATGWDDEDGVVEAIELPERRFALGVLWHPEEDERSGVIPALVEEAAARRGAGVALR